MIISYMIGIYRWIIGCLLQPHGINFSELPCFYKLNTGDVVVVSDKICNLKPHIIAITPNGRSFYYLYIGILGAQSIHQHLRIDVDNNNRLIKIVKGENINKSKYQRVEICPPPKTIRQTRWLGKLAGTSRIKAI